MNKFVQIGAGSSDLDKNYEDGFANFKIKNISFEHLHLSFIQKLLVVYKLTRYNYYYSGLGFDVRKSDWLFSKNYKKYVLRTFLLPFTPRRIWKRFSFSSLIQ